MTPTSQLTPSPSKAPKYRILNATRPEKPSLWLWVPWVWLFFASTRTISTWMLWGRQDRNASLDVSGSPIDQIVMTLLMVLGLWVLALRSQKVLAILSGNKWIIVLFAYMAMSVTWSNFPAISLRRDVRSTGVLIMALVVLSERSPLAAVRSLLWRVFAIHIPLSIIAIKFVRNIGVEYNWSGLEEQWVGLTTDKNSMGQVAMIAGVFFLWLILQSGRKKIQILHFTLFAMSLWLARGSKTVHSAAAILGIVICGLVLIALQGIRGHATRAKKIIGVAAIGGAFLAPCVYLAFLAFDTTPVELVLRATGRDMTLTDRTLIWTDLMNNAAKSPIVGVGIGAFWVGELGNEMYPMPHWSAKTPEWRPTEGHNGYVDTYVELGVVGIAIMMVVITSAALGSLDTMQHDFQLGSLRVGILVAILMNNIAETSFLKGTHDLWFLFILLAINLPRLRRKPSDRMALEVASSAGSVLG